MEKKLFFTYQNVSYCTVVDRRMVGLGRLNSELDKLVIM